MRAIGYISSAASAKTLGDYLYVQGIENLVEEETPGKWTVWVHSEEQLDQAKEILAAYQLDPNNPKYRSESTQAEALREEAARADRAYAARVKTRTTLFRRMAGFGLGPTTCFFMVLCSVIFIWTHFGRDDRTIAPLLISAFTTEGGGFLDRLKALEEIQHGQVWRLFTPMLVHFGFLHIIFNMLWLRDLGSMIEARFSGRYLCTLILVIAGLSNLAEFMITGPNFGGMSGVVYGLFGFIWMRARFDPNSGLFLHPTTVTMMIVWFFICFAQVIPGLGVANYVHATGLVAGMLWGWLPTVARKGL